MKTKLIIGMLAFSILAGNAFAVTGKMREAVNAKKAKVTSEVLGEHKSFTAAAKQAKELADTKILRDLDLGANSGKVLKMLEVANSSEAVVAQRLEFLTTAKAARELAKDWMANTADKNSVEHGRSLKEAADVLLENMLNSDLIGVRKTSKEGMSKAELADTSGALGNMQKQMENIMTMEIATRTKFIAMIKAVNAAASNPAISPEDALFQAALKYTNGDRAKAMELIRKIKDCV